MLEGRHKSDELGEYFKEGGCEGGGRGGFVCDVKNVRQASE